MRIFPTPKFLKFILRSEKIEILPTVNIKYFSYLLLYGVVAILIVDRFLIPKLEDQKKLVGFGWYDENIRININNSKKIFFGSSPAVWSSKGFPVAEGKSKSRRILVMGDSFVWGDGYSNMNYLWWRQLQLELERRGYPDVEVIAAGACGLSTRQELELARKIVPKYKPDLIVWGYVTNDPDEQIVKQSDLAQEQSFRTFGTYFGNFFPNLNILLQNSRMNKIRVEKSSPENGFEYRLWEIELLKGMNFHSYERTVKELSDFISNSKIPQFFITLPTTPDESAYNIRYEKIEPLFKSKGVPFYNVFSEYLQQTKSSEHTSVNSLHWGINPGNGHPGTFSTHLYASLATDILVANYSQFLGEPDRRRSTVPIPRINDWMPFDLNLVTSKNGAITFQYPTSTDDMLQMPIRSYHVRLNFEKPVLLKQIRVFGKNLKVSQIWISGLNSQLGYGDEALEEYPATSGPEATWSLRNASAEKKVLSILLTAEFLGQSRQVDLDFN